MKIGNKIIYGNEIEADCEGGTIVAPWEMFKEG